MDQTNKSGNVRITDRKTVSLTGICAVERFDETSVCLESTLGTLNIEGEGLHITSLDLERGLVEACGRIDALYYTADEPHKEKRGIFGFRGR